MRQILNIFLFILVLSSFLIFPAAIAAPEQGNQIDAPQQGTQGITNIPNPIQCDKASSCMARIAQIVAQIALPLVVVFIIYSGFLFVSARGNEEQLEKAKSPFFWAVIGAILVVGAYAIATAIENFAKQL